MLSGFCLFTITSNDQLNRQIMKVEVTNKKIYEISYPKLMQSILDDKIVLMLKKGTGILLKKGTLKTKRSVGNICDNYVIEEFKLFEGKITLENE